MHTKTYAKLNILIAIILALSLLLTTGGQPVSAQEPINDTKTYIGSEGLELSTPYEATHWDDVWDLTKGDLTLSYTIDMNNVLQPGTCSKYNRTTLYAEVGVRGEGSQDFNPGTAWDTYQGSCGAYMVSDDDTWNDVGDGKTETCNLNPDGIQDLDDKHSLSASPNRGERDYDVLDGDGVFGYDAGWDVVGPTRDDPTSSDPARIIGAYGSWNNEGIWWDRDGVGPFQSTKYANTGGIYDIVLVFHAIDANNNGDKTDDGLGVVFATVNGEPQGFYADPANWDGTPEYKPAGLSFKGDMEHMQVFAGVWGPNSDAWAISQYGLTYFDYGSVTLSNMTASGILGTSDPLVPGFSFTPAPVEIGEPVQFTNASDGGMDPYSYLWNFGDGTTSTEQNPIHTFTTPGTYNVKLVVTPFRCVPKEVTKQIVVTPKMGQLTVLKFSDENGNGLFDAGELGVPGWHIRVYQAPYTEGDTLVAEGDTDASGQITFTLPIGAYIVKEDTSDTGWIATTGDTIAVTVEADSGTYDTMYATGFDADIAQAVEVTLDPYNPPNHAMRLNPANALGPFDAVSGPTLNQLFFAVASQTKTDFNFAENFFNVEGVPDIEFAEVTWSAWHTEAAKVYLTDAVVNGVPYGEADDGIGYYAGIVWNKVGIVGIDAATRNAIAQSYLQGGITRTFADNEFYVEGNYGVSGFNLPAEVDYASDITLVDITKDVYNRNTIPTTLFVPSTYTNVGGTGKWVMLTSFDPFTYAELGTADGNTDGYDLDAIRVRRPVAFGNMPLLVDLAVEKDGPLFAILGTPLNYTYQVTNLGNTAAEPELTDDKCSPVVFTGGDTDGDRLVDPGETWQFTCSYTPVGQFFNYLLTNTATVMPADVTVVDVDLSNNSDTYSIGMWTLRKDVLLYWEGINVQYSDPNTPFTIELYKDFPKGTEGSIYITTLTIKESDPAELWLSEGKYYIYEINLPAGYSAARTNWFLVENQTNRRDMSVENLIHFDLKVEKSCPAFAVPGEEITYEYKVTNAGPAAVTPVLVDDKTGTPDMVLGVDGIHNIGDLDIDGKIDAGEEWLYTDEYLVPADQTENVVNIATVHDLEGEVYEPGHWHLGGDSVITNNSISCSAPVYKPTISKTALGSYDEVHDWEVFKSVNTASQSAFAGDKKNFTWTVRVDETTHGENYLVTGVITVVNPNPNAPLVVTLNDVLDDGSVADIGPCTSDPEGATLVGNVLTVPAGATATCEYEVVPTGDLADFAAALPDTVTMQNTNPGPESYWLTTVSNGGSLNGTYEGWCADIDKTIGTGNYTASVYSSYDDLPAGIIEKPENLDLVNWVINQGFVGTPSVGNGNFTYGDVQRAIWFLIEDNPTATTSGLGSYNQNRVNQILAAANAPENEGFTPTCGDFVAVILRPIDGSQLITIAQVTFASLGVSCAESNTVTAVVNGVEFRASADILWTANKINETASLDDDQKLDWPTTVSADGLFTYADPQGYTCPSDPTAYTNGYYEYVETNQAVLTFDTGSDEASATTRVKCYAPVLSKDATATYDETHTWSITKSVDPTSQSGYPGAVLPWTWTVGVSETSADSNFAVSGTITVANPIGSPGAMTVALADKLDDETIAAVDCDNAAEGYQTSITVATGASGTCSYSAAPTGKTATLNTVTGTFNSIPFTATADVDFTANVIGGSATVTDTQIGLEESLTGNGAGSWSYSKDYSHTCSLFASAYGEDGTYGGTLNNTANLTASNDQTASASASTTYTCQAGFMDLLKLTDGLVNSTKDWKFELYAGPDGFGGTAIGSGGTLGDSDGWLDFGAPALSPAKTYTVCELGVPAGWTSFWQVDINGDGIIDQNDPIVVPYNPNEDDSVPQDLGNRCVDFGKDTDIPVTVGETIHFLVDNSYPGGAPRTPGYWKNWNACTIGGQAATAAANGGWQEGYWLLEDVLNPTIGGGIVWDDVLSDNFLFPITSCELGVNILGAIDDDGTNRNSDAAYTLAKHLFAAQLNFAAGAETCTAATDAALAGETLLDSIDFNASGPFLASNDKKVRAKYNEALALAKTLDQYNNGLLCGMEEEEPVVPPVEPPGDDLAIAGTPVGSSAPLNKRSWKATVIITVNPAVTGAIVTGNFNGKNVTCTTDAAGMCTVSTNVAISENSIIYTLSNITLTGYKFDGVVQPVTINKP